MKKIFAVVLLSVSCAAFAQQNSPPQNPTNTLQFRDEGGNVFDSKLYFGPERPKLDFSEIRAELENQLTAVILPAGPVTADSVESIVENIRYVLHLVSLHIARENRLLQQADYGVIFVSSPPLSYGLESLDEWVNQQGCIQSSTVAIGRKDDLRGFVGRTTFPIQVPVSVRLQLENGGTSLQHLPMFLNFAPEVKFLQ